MVFHNAPIRKSVGKLQPGSAVYSINTLCKLIDEDRHCWLAMKFFCSYVNRNKRSYSLVHLKFIIEYLEPQS